MSSLKEMKPVGTQPTELVQPTEPVKKEPAAKSSRSAPRVLSRKPLTRKAELRAAEKKASGSSKPAAK